MISAGRYYKAGKSTKRRPSDGSGPAMEDVVKRLGDRMAEDIQQLAAILQPERPMDTSPLEDEDQWDLLERTAFELSPMLWDEPGAIRALYHLRQKFNPAAADPALLVYARGAERMKRLTPDLSITPENPEFAKYAARLGMKEAS